MDLPRSLFGALTSGVIRLIVAVGILAAAYLFIVKPVLHTTDNAINSANRTFERSFGTPHDGSPKRLLHCIERANGSVHRIHRCTARF
jgi:hypothetical protein